MQSSLLRRSSTAILPHKRTSLFKLPYLLIQVALVIAVAGCERTGGGTIGPGVAVPDIQYKTLSGETLGLRSFRGKAVVLNFLASWCAPCESEMPALNALHRMIKDHDATVVAIGVDDDPGRLKEFAQRTQIEFPLLVDTSGHSHRFFKIAGFPETVLLDKSGTVMMTPDVVGAGASSEPVVKFVGPRDWDNPYFAELMRKIASR